MYLINGELHHAIDLATVMPELKSKASKVLSRPFDPALLIDAAERLAKSISGMARSWRLDEPGARALADLCNPSNLHAKLDLELGSRPFVLSRPDPREARYEAWAPLGRVVQITSGNAPLVGIIAAIESLLVGNVTWIRPSSSDGGQCALVLQALAAADVHGQLADYLAVLPVSRDDIGWLLSGADGLAVWGGDKALADLRGQLPSGCRWIPWGHRIGISYVVPDHAHPADFDAIADDVCALDQQACSSPQCVLVDTDDAAVLAACTQSLATALGRRHARWPAAIPNEHEQAQITASGRMLALDRAFAGHVGDQVHGVGWRLDWSTTEDLAASDLFRTVHVRPMPRARLVPGLARWRGYLQTCLLVTHPADVDVACAQLIRAGVTRITSPGQAHAAYPGEPHDGTRGLTQLARRVSVSLPALDLSGRSSLAARTGALNV